MKQILEHPEIDTRADRNRYYCVVKKCLSISPLNFLLFEKYFLSLHSFLLNAENPWIIKRDIQQGEDEIMAKLYFNTRDELNRIDVSKIVYFEADGNYTDIVMVNKLHASVCMNLSEMEKTLAEQLGPNDTTFMRIGKRFIVNMQYIYQINVLKQQLILSDYDHFAFQVTISKEALRKVKDLMLQTRI